jgi:hypothetical protein
MMVDDERAENLNENPFSLGQNDKDKVQKINQ